MSDFNQLSDDNLDKLQHFYETNRTARAVLDAISRLRRYEIVEQKNVNTVCITVPTLSQSSDIQDSDVKLVFKFLETIKCGVYFESRRGFEARLQLSVDLKLEIQRFKDSVEIEIASEPRISDVRHLLKAPPMQQMKPTVQVQSTSVKATIMNHNFRLRVNLELELRLPKDLTVNEAERLSMFIKSQVLA